MKLANCDPGRIELKKYYAVKDRLKRINYEIYNYFLRFVVRLFLVMSNREKKPDNIMFFLICNV